MPKLRKPNHRLGGTQVTICGKPVSEGTICTLPIRHGSIHATTAVMVDGSVVALIRREGLTEVEAWQLAEAPVSPK